MTPLAQGMVGSMILNIANQMRALVAEGRQICNLTLGDFAAPHFAIPEPLADKLVEAVREGTTNYPPPDGMPELKSAIARLYRRKLGLDYPAEAVCVGSGARPPIYATWRLFVEPGDRTVSFLPAWNMGYYAQLAQSDHKFVVTQPENRFHPTAEQAAEAMRGARMVLLNTPLNPTGTAISREAMKGIAQALVEENRGRDKPCMLLLDQVYWLLRPPGVEHWHPVALVPEAAPYVVNVDAVSKCFAATGLRVGWGVAPPYLQGKMREMIGHMGAWAPKPEQLATAWFLDQEELFEAYIADICARLDLRLRRLYEGIQGMRARGLPVDAHAPQGAIYLSLHVDLIGRGFDTNEQIRRWLLEKAGAAVVPFQAFDLEEENGWFRMSVGAVGPQDIDDVLTRLERLLSGYQRT